MSKLRFARISVEQAVYAINTKIIPAMLYPLQVAQVPRSLLKQWDLEHRKIVRRVGALPKAIPTPIFHLPDKSGSGGIGLTSMEDTVDTRRIQMQVQALNDSRIGTLEEEKTQTQARITRAGLRNKE